MGGQGSYLPILLFLSAALPGMQSLGTGADGEQDREVAMAYRRKVAVIVEGGKMKGNRNGNSHKWSAKQRAHFEATIAAKQAKVAAKVARKGAKLQLSISNGGVATSYFQNVEAAASSLKVSPRDLALAIIDVAYPS